MRKLLLTLSILISASALLFSQQPGDFDTTFGNNGYTVTNVANNFNMAYSSDIQEDGKIVVVGRAKYTSPNYEVALARYNSDGTLDNTFGNNGITITAANTMNNYAMCVKVLENGKILVGGYSQIPNSYAVMLMRYNSDGTIDTTFGGNNTGFIISQFNSDVASNAEAMAIQSDGKIILGGYFNDRFAVYRYTQDGVLDTTFGTEGYANIQIDNINENFIKGIAVQEDDKIVAAGFGSNGIDADIVVVRYNADGSLDSSFGQNGVVIQAIGSGHDFLNAVVIQPDGKIVVGGHKWERNIPELVYDFILVRYNTDGSIDNTFGSQGVATAQFNNGENAGYLYGLAMQEDGKFVAVGQEVGIDVHKTAMVRFNGNGSIDTSFGNNGHFTGELSENESRFWHSSIQPDGNIVAVGYALVNNDHFSFMVSRIIGKDGGSAIVESDNKIGVYPNPTTDFIQVETGFKVNSYEIIDIAGKVVASGQLNENKTVNVSALNKGIYMIKLNGTDNATTAKFIKR